MLADGGGKTVRELPVKFALNGWGRCRFLHEMKFFLFFFEYKKGNVYFCILNMNIYVYVCVFENIDI